MSVTHGPISDLFAIRRRVGDFVLTRNGTLVGAIALSGRDPDGLSADDHLGLSLIARRIYTAVDPSIAIVQCYAHYDGAQVQLKRRTHPVSDRLSSDREAALNSRRIASANLVHFFEIAPREDLNRLNPKGFLKHGFQSLFNESSRAVFLNYLSDQGVVYVQQAEIERQSIALLDTLKQVASKWSGVMKAEILTASSLWAQLRFMATLDPRYFVDGLKEAVPTEDLDLAVCGGDIAPKLLGPMDVLKLNGARPRYCRIAAITKMGRSTPGFWGEGEKPPIRAEGNYVLVNRWQALTEFQRAMLFHRKEQDLHRQNLDVFQILQGEDQNTSAVEQRARMKPQVRAKLDELAEADQLEERWGVYHSFAAVFGDAPDSIRQTTVDLERALTQRGMSLTWETVDLPNAFATLQPGGKEHSIRDLTVTGAQLGATSMMYRSATGQLIVPDLGGEEPHYFLETDSGEVFAYSDFVGGRSFVLAVGPTRSGKTFFKNTLTTNFLKYGGMVYCADIDPGSEAVAMLYGDDGGIFRVGHDTTRGFNPFVSADGPDDRAFITHLTQLLRQMMLANDEETLRCLEPLEQDELDKAIVRTLRMPKDMQRFSALCNHMPSALEKKFARWRYGDEHANDGVYAPLFDAVTDSIGAIDKKVSVFNVQALRDDPNALKPVFMELFYRITRVFENPRYRQMPKRFEVDEAKHLLSIPYAREFLNRKTRTWGKHGAGITMWTQSPMDYLSIGDDWDAIRTAATTFVFLADPNMDQAAYKEAFHLSQGECDAIADLQPRREAYIVQRELGVSKRVLLTVEPVQDLVNTSHPQEASIRDALIATHGFEKGLELAVDKVQAFRDRAIEQDIQTSLIPSTR